MKKFVMNMHLEEQIRAINLVPAKQRILHIDATGSLTKIAKYMREYATIYNYFFLVKDSKALEENDKKIFMCKRNSFKRA